MTTIKLTEHLIETIQIGIKPCPFCGSVDVHEYYDGFQPYADSTSCYIFCRSCHARGGLVYRSYSMAHSNAMTREAIDNWNKRSN